MSTDHAISARGLGKRYVRGARKRDDSVRDLLQSGVKNLFRGNKAQQEADMFWALQDASFDVARGENVGIIGLNGAGKSTLLKVLSRIITPTEGSATINGRLGALLEVGTGFHPELTGRENTFLYGSILGMPREEVAEKFDRIVDFAEIGEFIDTPVKRYSSGMYVRLAFAVAAHLDPDILLLDEVLAVGDFAFQRKCMRFAQSLEKRGATILFVSHNMFSIRSMCPRVIYLKRGQIVFDGPVDEGLRMYEQDSRLAEAPWFKPDDPMAPRVTITDVAITNENGAETGVFNFGERLVVRVSYTAPQPVERPDFRIGFNRVDDIHCMTFSSLSDAVDIPVIHGEGVIELRTPPIKLVSDLYKVNLVVRDFTQTKILCAQVGGHFHVRHPNLDPGAYGVFHEAGEWQMLSAKAAAETADARS